MTTTLPPQTRRGVLQPPSARAAPGTVAGALYPLLRRLLGPDLPVRVRAWDGSVVGPPSSPTTIVIESPNALRRMLYAPGELGLSRAYVAGDLSLEGDVFDLWRSGTASARPATTSRWASVRRTSPS